MTGLVFSRFATMKLTMPSIFKLKEPFADADLEEIGDRVKVAL